MISLIPTTAPEVDTLLHFIGEEIEVQMVGWLATLTLGSASQGCAPDLGTQQIPGPRTSTKGAAPPVE